jgi:CDP-diacylglycerol--serine O-phosphatidyltransferase
VRKIAIVPTLLTLGNGVCGFAAIAYASKILPRGHLGFSLEDNAYYYGLSGLFILMAMVFDALDGYAARLSKTASAFGGQLDSLCDAISFGAAPAFLLLRIGQDWSFARVRQAIAVVAALYLVCAILRLARFNVENSPDPSSHKRFKGLPSPAAGGCLAALAILDASGGWFKEWFSSTWTAANSQHVHDFVQYMAPVGALFVALLMVSRVPYPHLTNQLLRGRRPFRFIVQAVLLVFVVALVPDVALFLAFWIYTLSGPIRLALVRGLRDKNIAQHHPELPR